MEGIVYGIREISSDEIVYVGSTIQSLNKRKGGHLHYCFIKNSNFLVYRHIREITDKEHFNEHFVFEVLDTDEFNDRTELRIRERQLIEQLKPMCNIYKAFRSKEEKLEQYNEWAKRNSDYLNDYYRKRNKSDHRREYMREYFRTYRARKKLA